MFVVGMARFERCGGGDGERDNVEEKRAGKWKEKWTCIGCEFAFVLGQETGLVFFTSLSLFSSSFSRDRVCELPVSVHAFCYR